MASIYEVLPYLPRTTKVAIPTRGLRRGTREMRKAHCVLVNRPSDEAFAHLHARTAPLRLTSWHIY